tara:strand:- start:5331 stop:6794 length:1464 start_codon:yes stop_codon:yes gene_type:complete
MNYKIYENVLTEETINHILSSVDEKQYHNGRVGAGKRVNLKQKNRKDLFINDVTLLSYIDNIVYSSLYEDIKENFCDIKFREKWKLGKYLGEENAFYNMHRDNSDETAYRCTSMIIALSNPDEYTGGEFCFDKLNIEMKLNKGSALVFDSSMYHHVNTITAGKRMVLVSFFFNDEGRKIKKNFIPSETFTHYKPHLKSIKIDYSDLDAANKIPIKTHVANRRFGDVDYSDKGCEHTWTDSSDYWLEENNSDILFVTFAGMGWKDSIPTFIFHNFLKSYTNIDKLFLRDINCRYYLTGLKHTTNSLEDTVQLIKNIILKKNYKKVIALGCSAGGFAAILYGELIKFDKVLAFSPQTVLNHKKDTMIGDKYNAPKTCQWLTNRQNAQSDLYKKSLDLNNFRPFRSNIDIHYSVNANIGIDKLHALYLEDGDKCRVFEYPGNDHMVALTLRNNGKLKELIDRELVSDEVVLEDVVVMEDEVVIEEGVSEN